jgi:hypothetical protein
MNGKAVVICTPCAREGLWYDDHAGVVDFLAALVPAWIEGREILEFVNEAFINVLFLVVVLIIKILIDVAIDLIRGYLSEARPLSKPPDVRGCPNWSAVPTLTHSPIN